MRRLCIIVNPHAGDGRGSKRLPAVESALRGLGLPFRIERTRSLQHARELARGTLDTGEVAVAMGGDGLVGAVAGEIRGEGGVLGVVPGGRGNDFARKLGIANDPADACELLASGGTRHVDVADIDGRTYLGIASAGIDSDVQVVANSTRLPLGDLVYVYGLLRALSGWRNARWEVSIDGREHTFTGYSVAVSNSGVFGGGMYYVPDARLDDGLLDVVFSSAVPKRRYLANLPKVFKGAHTQEPGFQVLRCREVTFRADRPFTVFADGDPIADLPATVRVLPGALEVIAPAVEPDPFG